MTVLTATFAIAMIFFGIGSWFELLTGRGFDDASHAAGYRLVAGWAVTSLVAAGAAAVGAHLTLPAIVLCLAGVAGLAPLRQHRLCLPWLLGAWALALPLIWIASRIPPTMSDEFSHWLPNARFLIESDKFPDLIEANRWSAAPGYPPALAMISYGTQRLAASGFEAAPKIFNVMLAAAFGLVLARLLQPGAGRLLSLAVGVSAATILNPFFDPRVALATYTDIPSGFALAMSLAACWRASDEPDGRSWWRIAAPAVLLVLLRETNIVLAGGLGLGLLLLGRRGWRPLAVHGASSIGAFLLWRIYLGSIAQPPALSIRPISEWEWGAPWEVLRTLIVERLANNPLLGSSAIILAGLVVIAAAARARGGERSVRSLALLCAGVTVAWVGFLAWTYIAVFSPYQVATANSTWRYLSQLGASFVYLCTALLFHGHMRSSVTTGAATAKRLRWAGVLAAALVPAVFLVTWTHWRYDCRFPDVAAVRLVAHALGPVVEDQSLAVVHPADAFAYATIVDYELHRPGPLGRSTGVPRRGDASQEIMVDLSGIDRDRLLRGEARPPVQVMRRVGDGWAAALTIPGAPTAMCAFAGEKSGSALAP